MTDPILDWIDDKYGGLKARHKKIMLFGANPEVEDVIIRQGGGAGLQVFDNNKAQSLKPCRVWDSGFEEVTDNPECSYFVVCGVASTPEKRRAAVLKINRILYLCDNWTWTNVVSETAYKAVSAKMGNGILILDQSYVGPQAEIEDHAVLLPGARIYHNARLGKGSILVGSSTVLGRAVVREYSRVCAAAVVLPEGDIGPGATIGAATTVKQQGRGEVSRDA